MWNYRLWKVSYPTEKDVNGKQYKNVCYEIRETYYNEDGSIWAVSSEPNKVISYLDFPEDETQEEKVEELERTLEWMKLALTKEVLDLDTFVFSDQMCEIDDEEVDSIQNL